MANQNPDGDGAASSSGRGSYTTRVRTGTERAEVNSSRSTTQAEWNSSRSTTHSEIVQTTDSEHLGQGGSVVLAGAGALFQSPPPTPRTTIFERTSTERSITDSAPASQHGNNRVNDSEQSHRRLPNGRVKRRASTLDDATRSRRSVVGPANELRASPTGFSESDESPHDESHTNDEDSDDNGRQQDQEGTNPDGSDDFQRSSTPRG